MALKSSCKDQSVLWRLLHPLLRIFQNLCELQFPGVGGRGVHVLPPGGQRQVGGDNGAAARAHELETLLLARRVQVVEEDAADATGHAAVLDAEVVIAPRLELAVIFGVVIVTDILQSAVEVNCVLLVKIVRGEVTPATEPPSLVAARLLHLEVSVVEVYGGDVRVAGVYHRTYSAREERHLLTLGQLLAAGVHLRDG